MPRPLQEAGALAAMAWAVLLLASGVRHRPTYAYAARGPPRPLAHRPAHPGQRRRRPGTLVASGAPPAVIGAGVSAAGAADSSRLSAAAAAAAAASASAGTPAKGGEQSFWRKWLPALLVGALVLQKCSTDGLTWYTRTRAGIHYSGASVALLSEVFKFPLLAAAVAVFESPKQVVPTFKAAATQAPFLLCWVGAAYATQNLLYFVCLDHISAAGYQVLSQSKLIFTAILMRILLKKQFSYMQLAALGLLCVGSLATQIGESSGGHVLGGGGNVPLGCALTVLSALLAALPNVFYERLLKKANTSEYVANLQLTTWIFIWVAGVKAWNDGGLGGGLMSLSPSGLATSWANLTEGFTPSVWAIVFLKTLNCIIIPACLKYADNILYGYAKPSSIVLTCVITAIVTSSLPPVSMVAGISLVLLSMWMYSKG